MPSLLCPECRKELLPQHLLPKGENLACPKCGRDIYEPKKERTVCVCPTCGDEISNDNFLIVEKR